METNSPGIKLSDFSLMSEVQRKERVDALFEAAINPSTEQKQAWIERINTEIQKYESRYKMSSDEMLQALKSHERMNIPEICTWLMVLKTRDQVRQKYRDLL